MRCNRWIGNGQCGTLLHGIMRSTGCLSQVMPTGKQTRKWHFKIIAEELVQSDHIEHRSMEVNALCFIDHCSVMIALHYVLYRFASHPFTMAPTNGTFFLSSANIPFTDADRMFQHRLLHSREQRVGQLFRYAMGTTSWVLHRAWPLVYVSRKNISYVAIANASSPQCVANWVNFVPSTVHSQPIQAVAHSDAY